ncbi:hypothetical protein FSP39_015511 [Pinctada imbricata]|uniref:DUF4371 domain-containing protein n=1 Tax=Pinctada imbricata TaxID=66713 RepID=A0AA88XMJ5_PINIB|nr:hypothetical protein FSP39_015511 [Pinctada imbricata]
MFCTCLTWCRDNKVDSNFVTGTGNFKLETVKQHEATKWHMYYAAKYAKAEGEAPAVKCLKQLLQQDAEKLQHKFRTAHVLAKHGKSFLDFNFICSLDKVKGLDVGSTYCNDKAARCFVASIAYTERMKIIDKIRDAKFFSFSCDGTTDFTGEDLECFYIRICSKGTINVINFCSFCFGLVKISSG